MRKTLISLVLFAPFWAQAQRILPQSWSETNTISGAQIRVGNSFTSYGLGFGVNSDYYWNEEFKKAKVYFYPQDVGSVLGGIVRLDSLSGVLVRFDLWNNRLEFETEKEVKIITAKKVAYVLFKDEVGRITQYINPREFNILGLNGLFELLNVKDEKIFLHLKEILVKKANYNAVLDTGSKNDSFSKKDHYYYWNGKDLEGIDSKKSVTNLLTSLGLDAKKYFKGSKNKLKTTKDYKNLAHFILETLS